MKCLLALVTMFLAGCATKGSVVSLNQRALDHKTQLESLGQSIAELENRIAENTAGNGATREAMLEKLVATQAKNEQARQELETEIARARAAQSFLLLVLEQRPTLEIWVLDPAPGDDSTARHQAWCRLLGIEAANQAPASGQTDEADTVDGSSGDTGSPTRATSPDVATEEIWEAIAHLEPPLTVVGERVRARSSTGNVTFSRSGERERVCGLVLTPQEDQSVPIWELSDTTFRYLLSVACAAEDTSLTLTLNASVDEGQFKFTGTISAEDSEKRIELTLLSHKSR